MQLKLLCPGKRKEERELNGRKANKRLRAGTSQADQQNNEKFKVFKHILTELLQCLHLTCRRAIQLEIFRADWERAWMETFTRMASSQAWAPFAFGQSPPDICKGARELSTNKASLPPMVCPHSLCKDFATTSARFSILEKSLRAIFPGAFLTPRPSMPSFNDHKQWGPLCNRCCQCDTLDHQLVYVNSASGNALLCVSIASMCAFNWQVFLFWISALALWPVLQWQTLIREKIAQITVGCKQGTVHIIIRTHPSHKLHQTTNHIM